MSIGHNFLYQMKSIFIMYINLKYQSPNTFGSIDKIQVKVFQN
jgi:hypothetical protein